MLPLPLWPNYLGDYGRGYRGYVSPLVRDTSDLFGLSASTYWPPITGEPQESLLDGIVARQRLHMSGSQTTAVAAAEEQNPQAPNGLSIEREPGVPFDIGRQLREPVEAPQTAPNVDTRLRQPFTHMAPNDDGATALQDRRIAEYEARLQNSWARASAAYDAGCRDPEPVAATGAGLLRRAGHGYLLHPDQVSRPSRLAADTSDGPWARHQQRAHR